MVSEHSPRLRYIELARRRGEAVSANRDVDRKSRANVEIPLSRSAESGDQDPSPVCGRAPTTSSIV
jgi:hypothetical protein